MPNRDHFDYQYIFFYVINYSVVTLSYTVAVPPFKFFAARWPRFSRQRLNKDQKRVTNVIRQFIQLLNCRFCE